MTHGGKRPGAGRPKALIDEKRMMRLIEDGFTRQHIADRFQVKQRVIARRVAKIKKLADG